MSVICNKANPQSTDRRGFPLVCLAAGLLGLPVAHAGGIYLSEIGSPNSLGTAASGNVTNRDIADSAWTNPAGMTGIDEAQMLTGLQVLVPKTEFESTVAEAGGGDGGNAGQTAAIPSFFYVRPINDDWRFGLSMVAPFGGGFDFGDVFWSLTAPWRAATTWG